MDEKSLKMKCDEIYHVIYNTKSQPYNCIYDNYGNITELGNSMGLEKPIIIFTYLDNKNILKCCCVFKLKGSGSLQIIAPDALFLTKHGNLKSIRYFEPYRKCFKLIYVPFLNDKNPKKRKNTKFIRRNRHYKMSKKIE